MDSDDEYKTLYLQSMKSKDVLPRDEGSLQETCKKWIEACVLHSVCARLGAPQKPMKLGLGRWWEERAAK
eukprot:1158507-Pelagomonas_calceolata.AAC.1